MVYLLLKMWMFPIGGIPHPFQNDQSVCPIGGGISWVNCAKRLVQHVFSHNRIQLACYLIIWHPIGFVISLSIDG